MFSSTQNPAQAERKVHSNVDPSQANNNFFLFSDFYWRCCDCYIIVSLFCLLFCCCYPFWIFIFNNFLISSRYIHLRYFWYYLVAKKKKNVERYCDRFYLIISLFLLKFIPELLSRKVRSFFDSNQVDDSFSVWVVSYQHFFLCQFYFIFLICVVCFSINILFFSIRDAFRMILESQEKSVSQRRRRRRMDVVHSGPSCCCCYHSIKDWSGRPHRVDKYTTAAGWMGWWLKQTLTILL